MGQPTKPHDVQAIVFKNMNRVVFKTSEAVANCSGAMEADTIQKHGRNSKSLTSRVNKMKRICLFFAFFSLSIATAFAQEPAGKVSNDVQKIAPFVKKGKVYMYNSDFDVVVKLRKWEVRDLLADDIIALRQYDDAKAIKQLCMTYGVVLTPMFFIGVPIIFIGIAQNKKIAEAIELYNMK